MNEINIGSIIHQKRKEYSITQEQFAKHIGVSKASVSKWENNQCYPDIVQLPKIAAYFNITIDELVSFAPQLTRKEIQEIYQRLAGDFAQKPFERVCEECNSLISHYFSCFPFLFQMAILLLNHFQQAPTPAMQNELLEQILSLCQRISIAANDSRLSMQANNLAAQCLLIQGKAQGVLDLLDFDENAIFSGNESSTALVANAYLLLGEHKKTSSILQCEMYKNLLHFFQAGSMLLSINATHTDASERIISHLKQVADTFDLEHLHINSYLIFYLYAAQNYAVQHNPSQAIACLQAYTNACINTPYPITLHGDAFFDQLDSYLSEADFFTAFPRDTKAIKESMLTAVSNNPLFAPLADNPDYKLLIQQLTKNLGGSL